MINLRHRPADSRILGPVPLPKDENLPEYCCAVIRDHAGRYLLEVRPPEARAAAGLLTCFGGRREPGEHANDCIARELREELGLRTRPDELGVPRLILRLGTRTIAWFYALTIHAKTPLQTEAGRSARWISAEDLDGQPLSPWHAAAISALAEGRQVVDLAPRDPDPLS